MNEDQIVGCILGTAVGDAIGLPYEGLSRQRAVQLLGAPDRYRFLFGRGMVSDDTEHTCLVAQSLIIAKGDAGQFRQSLAWGLRWWLLGLPAGIGIATLRSICRLWLGFSPEHSGVFSAGNGPAMRAAILGVSLSEVPVLREFVRVSSRMTHTDPKANLGAFVVAFAARMAAHNKTVTPEQFLHEIRLQLGNEAPEFVAMLSTVVESVRANKSTLEFADEIGLSRGVSGYMYHTVPVAIHAWLSHQQDYRQAVTTIIQCGGDTDSTAAIVGGIVGAAVGRAGIPEEWLSKLVEWPRSVHWMEVLGKHLSTIDHLNSQHSQLVPRPLPVWGIGLRNLLFLVVVLSHGFRRLAPPY